mmetsp:Transcript_13850/g.27602  ORF Transcript_13850/g.27602 Transcript_13850/m.27602 type:complete len:88 (+) Transcript_13850:28-291(+)
MDGTSDRNAFTPLHHGVFLRKKKEKGKEEREERRQRDRKLQTGFHNQSNDLAGFFSVAPRQERERERVSLPSCLSATASDKLTSIPK